MSRRRQKGPTLPRAIAAVLAPLAGLALLAAGAGILWAVRRASEPDTLSTVADAAPDLQEGA